MVMPFLNFQGITFCLQWVTSKIFQIKLEQPHLLRPCILLFQVRKFHKRQIHIQHLCYSFLSNFLQLYALSAFPVIKYLQCFCTWLHVICKSMDRLFCCLYFMQIYCYSDILTTTTFILGHNSIEIHKILCATELDLVIYQSVWRGLAMNNELLGFNNNYLTITYSWWTSVNLF